MISDKPIAVLDACVLAGTVRRLLLVALAREGAFTPVFSQRILDEAHRAIPKTYKNSAMSDAEKSKRADGVIASLVSQFPDGSVKAEDALSDITLPDPDDVHVVAAAVNAQARFIVTENLKDFPQKRLTGLGLEPISTDAFATLCFGSLDAAQTTHLLSRISKAFAEEFAEDTQVIETLRRVGLKKTAKFLL